MYLLFLLGLIGLVLAAPTYRGSNRIKYSGHYHHYPMSHVRTTPMIKKMAFSPKLPAVQLSAAPVPQKTEKTQSFWELLGEGLLAN
jgi:hypothetical protein